MLDYKVAEDDHGNPGLAQPDPFARKRPAASHQTREDALISLGHDAGRPHHATRMGAHDPVGFREAPARQRHDPFANLGQ